MSALTTKLPWDKAQPLWAGQLNPILANPLLNGQILSDIVLAVGANTIHHSLGHPLSGWIITDSNAAATIYRSQPFSSTTLTLTSSAAVTVSILVF